MSGTLAHRTIAELEAGLASIRAAPSDDGIVEMIVRRPDIGEREVLDSAQLDLEHGLVGDSWRRRRSSRTPDGSPHPDTQLNIMSSRVVALVAQVKERWPLAGDQIFIDFDLSGANVPPGTRLAIGDAVIEVSETPHTGCGKFIQRFGVDAAKFVNGSTGRELQLRGINARVVQAGMIRVGDRVRKITAE